MAMADAAAFIVSPLLLKQILPMASLEKNAGVLD